MKQIKLLPPFKNFVLENFPFIEEDFEALTNYQLLCHVVNYVKTMGAEFNEIAIDVNALINWFNNLDVQDEINNKLDEMAESGQLQEIVSSYLNSKAYFGFDNVESMINAENLIDGSYAETLGYYSKNDGGHGKYKIRTVTNDDSVNGGSLIAMADDSLVAELLEDEKDVVNVLQWGAIPDGETDNSTIFNKIIDYCNEERKNIFIPKGDYVVEDDLHQVKSNISIYGNVSGAGQFELKTTIIDKRTSENHLLTFTNITTGGTIQYINFKNMSNEYTNKCIKLINAQCYLGTIENCSFYQYGNALYLDRTHGLVIDKCSFVKCGSSQATAPKTDYGIYIYATVDCSINNCMIDHTRYMLFVDNQSYVAVTNTHFELTALNIVNGKAPVCCEVGLFGHVVFTGCIFIGLSYKHWVNELGLTPANVPFLINGSYIDLTNCVLSCGSGSGSYTTSYAYQCKFADITYGTIADCKVKRPSYLINAFMLRHSKMVDSHIQCDIETGDYSSITKNSRIIYSNTNNSAGNYLQFIISTTNPQTYPTNYPVLYNSFSDMTALETNKGEIIFEPTRLYANLQDYNTLRLQSNTNLQGLYKLKVYSYGQLSLIYEGYFRIGSNNTPVAVSDIYKNISSGNSIKIYADDNSNDVYIQFIFTASKPNALIFKIEGLEGHPDLICYYVPSINEALTYSKSITISS